MDLETLIERRYDVKNALIKSADLVRDKSGHLTVQMELDGDDWGTIWVSPALNNLGMFDEPKGKPSGIEFIMRLMHVVGVSNFSELKGKYVRAALRCVGQPVNILGHITKDTWIDPTSDVWKE